MDLDRLGHRVEVRAELADLVGRQDGVRAEKSLSANRFTVAVSARIERVSTVPSAIDTISASAITPSEIQIARPPAVASAARIS